jgi:hypothetical protein
VSGTRQSNLDDKGLYESGPPIPTLIRELSSSHGVSCPFAVMYALMDAFHVGLGDVSCVDGWWPPEEEAAVTDEKLDRFVRDAIEARRAEWSRDL